VIRNGRGTGDARFLQFLSPRSLIPAFPPLVPAYAPSRILCPPIFLGSARLATTKTPKSSTASESKPRTRAAAPAAKKAAVAKKLPAAKKPSAAKKSPAAKKPAARTAAPNPASKPGKAVLANRAAAKRAAESKSTAKPAAKKPRKTAAAPVASPPQPKPRKPGPKVAAPTDIVERLRLEVRRALEELKAKDIVELDVRGKTSIADYIVVASGTSTRHVKSVSDEVVKYAKKIGMMPLGVEGQREAEWVLVDLGDIIVHVMLPRVREFYGLERLWSVGGDADAEAAYG
jgi:ribosome silencing factor RsfS/YbeB/iojap